MNNYRHMLVSTIAMLFALAEYDLFHVYHRKRCFQKELGYRYVLSPVRIHHLRYIDKSQEHHACPICKGIHETEIHFLFVCPKYATIRETYLLEKCVSVSSDKSSSKIKIKLNGNFTSECKTEITTYPS